MKPLSQQLEDMLTPVITGMGYDVVLVKMLEGNKTRTLQVMAERPDGSMTLDDCEAISRQLSAVLDVEDIIPGEYRLEVGSPGIDRPLRNEKEYAAYATHLVKVELVLPVAGRKRYTGAIMTAENGVLTLNVDGKPVAIPTIDIQGAKLVLTDALIKHHQSKAS